MASVSNGRGPRTASSYAKDKYEEFSIPQNPDETNIPPDAQLDSALSGNVYGQISNGFADFGSLDPTSFLLLPDPSSVAEASCEQPHRCDHPGCTMKFERQKDLRKHQKRVHTSRSERQHPCPACEMKFIWPKDLKRHKRSRHSEGKDNIREYLCPESDCDYNRRGFQRKDKMVRHWRRMHEAPRSQTACEQTYSPNHYGNLLIEHSNDLLSLSPPCLDSEMPGFAGFQDLGNEDHLLLWEPYSERVADRHAESENSTVDPAWCLETPWDLGFGTN